MKVGSRTATIPGLLFHSVQDVQLGTAHMQDDGKGDSIHVDMQWQWVGPLVELGGFGHFSQIF